MSYFKWFGNSLFGYNFFLYFQTRGCQFKFWDRSSTPLSTLVVASTWNQLHYNYNITIVHVRVTSYWLASDMICILVTAEQATMVVQGKLESGQRKSPPPPSTMTSGCGLCFRTEADSDLPAPCLPVWAYIMCGRVWFTHDAAAAAAALRWQPNRKLFQRFSKDELEIVF